jgi:hypothetical protein
MFNIIQNRFLKYMKYQIFSILKLMEPYNVLVYFLFLHIIVTTIQTFNVNICLNTIFINKFQIYLLPNFTILKISNFVFNLLYIQWKA